MKPDCRWLVLAALLVPSARCMCAGWCDVTLCTTNWHCIDCIACQPSAPPGPPTSPAPPHSPRPPALPPGPAHPPRHENPFAHNRDWYVDAERQAAIASALHSAEGQLLLPLTGDRERLRVIYNQPTAVWIDSIAAIPRARRALAAAARASPPSLVTLVVYNLPNRDCAAQSSGGEICCFDMPPSMPSCQLKWGGNCDHGLSRYRNEFIMPIAAILAEYQSVPTALIIEPDSLPNLVTSHTGECRGGATTDGYKRGVAHAVRTLAPLASAVYLDAGHGGWVGYETNLLGYLGVVREIGIWGFLRGFSSNGERRIRLHWRLLVLHTPGERPPSQP